MMPDFRLHLQLRLSPTSAINLWVEPHLGASLRTEVRGSREGVAAVTDAMLPGFRLQDPWAVLEVQPLLGLALAPRGTFARFGASITIIPQTHGRAISVLPRIDVGGSLPLSGGSTTPFVGVGVDIHTPLATDILQGTFSISAGYDPALGDFTAGAGVSVVLDPTRPSALSGALTRVPEEIARP